MDNKTVGIRFTEQEYTLVFEAFILEQKEGDRGGLTAWSRSVLLREAKRVLETATQKNAGG